MVLVDVYWIGSTGGDWRMLRVVTVCLARSGLQRIRGRTVDRLLLRRICSSCVLLLLLKALLVGVLRSLHDDVEVDIRSVAVS